jgi:hypothetical protein
MIVYHHLVLSILDRLYQQGFVYYCSFQPMIAQEKGGGGVPP